MLAAAVIDEGRPLVAQTAKRPDRQNRPMRPQILSEAMCGSLAAIVGGVIGWVAAFAGLGLWGLVVGLAATIVLLALVRDASVRRSFSVMAAFAFAFILLSWPVLWPIVGYIWSAITGHSFHFGD